jgi:hypothetical protein
MKKVQEAFTETGWFKDDPRYHIDIRASIIIIGTFDSVKKPIFAEVETDHEWFIHWTEPPTGVSTLGYGLDGLSADDNWPEGWVWTYVPWEKYK